MESRLDTHQLGKRSNYNQSYLMYENYFKTYLYSKLNKQKIPLSKKFSDMRNKISSTKNKIITKSKQRVSSIMKNKKNLITSYCVYYTQLNKKFDIKPNQIFKKSKTKDYFAKLHRKFEIGRQKYLNPDFNQIYAQLKAKYKLNSDKLMKNIEALNIQIFQMKKNKLLAKYTTLSLYAGTLGYLLFIRRLSPLKFFITTSSFIGIHMVTQYSITKYHLLKFKKLVI